MARPFFRLTPIAIALALAAGCGSDSTSPQPTPESGDITIVKGASLMTTTAFSPNPKTISLADGGQVRWVNADGGSSVYGGGTATAHQIMSDDAAFEASEPFSPGQSYTVILGAAGTYHYHCNIHPNMVGTITVTQ
ncbi:MAG TPA: plastocyanin/azurin family copper-binding protein [Gemmatimonadales bacterium]|nr:plastocyanin/azurin family copper-binding protein [Gemmatimonadales bacterium]